MAEEGLKEFEICARWWSLPLEALCQRDLWFRPACALKEEAPARMGKQEDECGRREGHCLSFVMWGGG